MNNFTTNPSRAARPGTDHIKTCRRSYAIKKRPIDRYLLGPYLYLALERLKKKERVLTVSYMNEGVCSRKYERAYLHFSTLQSFLWSVFGGKFTLLEQHLIFIFQSGGHGPSDSLYGTRK